MTNAKRIQIQADGGVLIGDDSGGDGPVIVAFPGLGDLRSEYGLLAPLLIEAGFRFISMDLRGHGESSVGFDSYTPEDVGRDAIAVLDQLGVDRATLMGTSFAAAAVFCAQALHPERIERIVVIGPFTRDMPADRWMRPLSRLLFNRLWGVAAWVSYWRSLFKDAPPADLAERAAAIRANLRESGRLEAVRAMMIATKQGAAEQLAHVTCPSVVIMGDKDPDFPDPAAEAERLAGSLGGPAAVHLIAGAGHYPQVEQPRRVADVILGASGARVPNGNRSQSAHAA